MRETELRQLQADVAVQARRDERVERLDVPLRRDHGFVGRGDGLPQHVDRGVEPAPLQALQPRQRLRQRLACDEAVNKRAGDRGRRCEAAQRTLLRECQQQRPRDPLGCRPDGAGRPVACHGRRIRRRRRSAERRPLSRTAV